MARTSTLMALISGIILLVVAIYVGSIFVSATNFTAFGTSGYVLKTLVFVCFVIVAVMLIAYGVLEMFSTRSS